MTKIARIASRASIASVRADAALQSAMMQLYDNSIPALEAGVYTITVQQDIKEIDTQGYFQPVTQEIEVRAPQFTLDPQEIHSVYPPADSNGIYGEILPHIVLNKRVLPWERLLVKTDKTIPWLALLLFQEDEVKVDPQTNFSTFSSTVAEFLQADPNVLKPAIDRSALSPEVLNSQCQSIIISADVFTAVLPRLPEVRYLAHCRVVNTDDQEILNLEDEGGFSVVVCNRFPQSDGSGGAAGAKNIAHLVSLEGFAEYLTENPSFPKKQGSNESKDIQLVSLKSWSFVSAPAASESFAQLLQNFVAQQGGDPQNLLLRLPTPDGAVPNDSVSVPQAVQRLQDGYVPLSYTTNFGEQTFSWYRGPFTPVIPQRLPKTVDHYTTVAETMIYIQAQGIFDLSYTAAWEIGRALALSDRVFALTLLQFRQQSYQLINMLLERLQSNHLDTPQDLQELLNNNLIKQKFDQLIAQDIGGQLTRAFTQLNANIAAAPRLHRTAARPARKASPLLGASGNNPEATPIQVTQDFLRQPEVQAFLQQQVKNDLQPIAEWLASLDLLYNLPFNHLVPDQRMLPVESIRFFYLDQNWLDTLTDGALSVGVESSRDLFFQQIIKGVIDDAISAEIKAMRSKLRGQATGDVEADSPLEAQSGVLIRSALVSGWPGLVVQAFQNDQPLKLLRMERLSSDVLLCIFLDIADTVQISEPPQGLRFGVEDGNIIHLRSLTPPIGKPLSSTFPGGSGGFSQFLRPASHDVGARVLRINDGNTSLIPALSSALSISSLGPADFALQMIKAPEQQAFVKPHSFQK